MATMRATFNIEYDHQMRIGVGADGDDGFPSAADALRAGAKFVESLSPEEMPGGLEKFHLQLWTGGKGEWFVNLLWKA